MSSYLGKTPPPGSMLKKGGPRAKAQNSSWREDRDGMSETHLALIRKLPCCVCRRTPVPLCLHDHESVERAGARNEIRWFKERGVEDVVWLASALWKATGNLPAMTRIVITHQDAKK